MELFKSLQLFIIGVLKRIYWILPTLVLDPFDFIEKLFKVNYDTPQWTIWTLFAVGWMIAIVLTYHELRIEMLHKVNNKTPAKQTTNTIEVQLLKFRVKVETLSVRQSSFFLDENTNQTTPKCLVMKISLNTNQVIQIASLHLEINSVDPRDIHEPSPHLVQGFQLPYILKRSETHEFQFEVLKKQGNYKMILKVLAGGNWYSDGPHDINL